MASIKTRTFLPTTFRTVPNKKFLAATMDQLYSKPDLRKMSAYVGRTFAPTFKSTDSYEAEPTVMRQNYQLEPGVVVTDSSNNVNFFSSYIDLLQQIQHYGGDITNHDRLFQSESYSFDGLFDFDKFVNFNQYYWLENGPDPIPVYGNQIELIKTYTVTRDPFTGGYLFSSEGQIDNPQLRLAHGGTYTFIVNQPGYPFWIQTEPGVSGTKKNQPNLSSRDVLGVVNNGTDVGEITFNVPLANAQDFYLMMPLATSVDLSTNLHYYDVQNHLLSELIRDFGGIDGVTTQLNNKTLIFTNQDQDDIQWTADGIFDTANYAGTGEFDEGHTVPSLTRRNVWTINLVDNGDGDFIVNLVPGLTISPKQKVYVKGGVTQAQYTFWLNGEFMLYNLVPDITAPLPYLFYQDGIESQMVGQMAMLDASNNVIDVDTQIIGQKNYKSPNGVTLSNGMKIQFDSSVTPSNYVGKTYYVEGVGTSIILVDVDALVVPETFLTTGSTNFDYLTINRASIDLNPWTRNNRWFHEQIIKLTAQYNNTTPIFDQTLRATRPIIEFEAGVQLFNFGVEAKTPVDVLDFSITDAFNELEGQAFYTLGGTDLTTGMRVVFANDFDPAVRNQIYVVNIVDIGGRRRNVITLAPSTDSSIVAGNNLIITAGANKGIQYYFDGAEWIKAQQKTTINQAPLFDVFDENGVGLSNPTFYPASTFAGTKLFSYQVGTGTNDAVLGFPLSYRNFNQIADIQFSNDFDSDVFSYTGVASQPINYGGLLKQNSSLTASVNRNVWVTTVEKSKQYQLIGGVYQGTSNLIEVDIVAATQQSVPYFRVYRNSTELDSTLWTYTTIGAKNYVQVTDPALAVGDRIDVLIYSVSPSALGYYQIPTNLDFNTLNANFSSLTLGQLRNHMTTISQNSTNIVGVVPGSSNLRDLYYKAQGGNILQHASPVLFSELFLVDSTANFMSALDYARSEYTKFKNKFLELTQTTADIDVTNIPALADRLIKTINAVKNNTFPWYYSDMVPYGDSKNIITYTVINAEIRDYEISSIFNDSLLGSKAVLVYVNGTQLLNGYDYTFDQTRAGVTINSSYSLNVGDIIQINEYNSTDGNYIPETPTKLGLYPKFKPEIVLDTTYLNPAYVIQGHDGSLTPAFGDFRDQLLLELEKRIYNNIKIATVVDMGNFVPGKFRDVNYSLNEFNQLLTRPFLKWVGSNRVDYTTNKYFLSSDPWTWNYKAFKDVISGNALPGTWRAIFRYFYDTERPDTHPWEMLGFSQMPDWWEGRYGPAPYTGGNMVLWGDLEQGLIYAGPRAGIDSSYARPGLSKIIPVDVNGSLRSPDEFIMYGFDSSLADSSYAVGDIGPVESAWRRSSEYPYALQQVMALSQPGFYFGTLMNVGKYFKNTALNQYVMSDTLQRIQPGNVTMNGQPAGQTVARAAGYLNWILDYIKSIGINPYTKVASYLNNVSIQLAYKMAAYSDKSMIQVIAEQSSPSSTNQGVVIPNENYKVQLFKSTPIQTVTYSAVIIEKSLNGYTVSGYNLDNPYFVVIPSIANNNAYSFQVGTDVAVVYNDYQKFNMAIPYGFEFNTKEQVVDFLISYERFLLGCGFQFNEFDPMLNLQRDFKLSAREFLTWSQQGWGAGNLIVVSPVLNILQLYSPLGTVDEVVNTPNQSRILDTNFQYIRKNKFTVSREDNAFTLTANYNQTISLAVLDVVQYEHVLIFDNLTVFNDVIYRPELGNRQYRLRIVGAKTGGWTGELNPPGFILNAQPIQSWQVGVDYLKGTIVQYKGLYYTALADVPASTSFSISQWSQLTSNELKTGLLPNFSTDAQKFNDFYDLDNPSMIGGYASYADGLIGFRERQYMTDFGISVETQAKFYQGYVKEKGTLNAVTAFTAADFNGITSNIQLYEEWAIRVGEYGALHNNKFAEVILPDSTFINSDPITITFLANGETSPVGSYGITANNVYKVDDLSTFNSDLYLNRDASSIYENDILTAGYVNINDIDHTLFDLSFYGDLNSSLGNIGIGSKIWNAKDYTGDWNVYRVNSTDVSLLKLVYGVNNVAMLTTKQPHGFATGDLLVIKGFDPMVDGVYQVYGLVDAYNFEVVLYQFLTEMRSRQTITGVAPIYKLVSMRIRSATDISSITPNYGWIDGDKLWIDSDLSGNWVVYNKSTPWTANVDPLDANLSLAANVSSNSVTALSPNYASNTGFGNVSAISGGGQFVLAGRPANGLVSVFESINGQYLYAGDLAPSNSVSSSPTFGTQIKCNNSVAYITMPSVNGSANEVYVYRYDEQTSFTLGAFSLEQTLHIMTSSSQPSTQLAVDSSDDGSWLAVTDSASETVNIFYTPSINANVQYTTAATINNPGPTGNGFGSSVKVDSIFSRIIVSAPIEEINGVLNAGAVYIFERVIEKVIADGTSNVFVVSTGINNAVTIANGVQVNGVVNNNYTVTGNTIEFNFVPISGSIITIETDSFQLLEKIETTALISGAMFGSSLFISGNANDIYVSSPGYTETGYHGGAVYRYTNVGQSYGNVTTTGFDPVVTSGDYFHINGNKVLMTGGTIANVAADINAANIVGISATLDAANNLIISSSITMPGQRLDISNVSGNVLANIGLAVFDEGQLIKHPNTSSVEQFGFALESTVDANVLVVGSMGGTTYNQMSLDAGATVFDYGSTDFMDGIQDAGAVYVYGKVPGELSATARDQYTLVQTLDNYNVRSNDYFGSSISMRGNVMIVGAPGDSQHLTVDPVSGLVVPLINGGRLYYYANPTGLRGWDIIRAQQPIVDTDSVLRFYVYNKDTNTIITNLDHYDPARGKILGAAQQDIDFMTGYDPAIYTTANIANVSVGRDNSWGSQQETMTWWNLAQVRFIDYEQDTINYRANHWGEMFPGSSVEVYEWVGSDQLPSAYKGDGTPLYPSDNAYVQASYVDVTTKTLKTKYFFWVRGKSSVNSLKSNKLNSVSSLESIISNPRAQGIPYAAALRSDTISLYGISSTLNGNSTVLHADYDTVKNTNIIHSEYQLLQDGNGNNILPTRIINKMQDSLAGLDAYGNIVPDPALPVQYQTGIEIRPRQSMFVNRLAALENFVEYVNNIFAAVPIVEEFVIDQLYSGEALPATSQFNIQVSTYAELTYIETSKLSIGFIVLVTTDETQSGIWTMYEFNGFVWSLIRRQSYYTPFYWSFTDWYDPSFDPTVTPTFVVNTVNDLTTLVIAGGEVAKVLNNGAGKYAFYRFNAGGTKTLVGIQNGTIQLNSSLYDSAVNAGNEIRVIFDTIKQFIFINTLQTNFNQLFFYLINYVLAEQNTVDWIFKTSFVSIVHQIAKLQQFPNYMQDNQTSYESYINEVKPYRTSLREYLIDYTGDDLYQADLTDFDLPGQYDANTKTYRSPDGSQTSDGTLMANSGLYKEWFNNHTYGIHSVIPTAGGTGFYFEPIVKVVGGGGTGANIRALVDYSTTSIVGYQIIDPGVGYTSTPQILINGTGTGAIGYPMLAGAYQIDSVPSLSVKLSGNIQIYAGNILLQPASGASGIVYQDVTSNVVTLTNYLGTFVANAYVYSDFANLAVTVEAANPYIQFLDKSYNVVRSIETSLKFDRVAYQSNVVTWQPKTTVTANTIVSYNQGAFISTTDVYSSARVQLTGLLTANLGTFVGQEDSTVSSQLTDIALYGNVITVSNISGSFNLHGGNIRLSNVPTTYVLNPATYDSWYSVLGDIAVNNDNYSNTVAVNGNGDIYVIGGDGNTSPINFIAKYNSLGALQWVKSFQNPNGTFSIGDYLLIDQQNYMYALFNDPVASNSYVVKMDSEANILWQQQVSDVYFVNQGALSLDSTGNIFTFGTERLSANATSENYTLMKFDPTGLLLYQRYLTDYKYDSGFDVVTLSDDSVVVTGNENNSPNNLVVGRYNNADGSRIWEVSINNLYSNNPWLKGTGIARDSLNNIYVSAYYFDTTSTNSYISLFKFNSAGGLVWQEELTPTQTSTVWAYSTALVLGETDDFIYVTGGVQTPAGGANSLLLMKVNTADGSLNWARQFGGVGTGNVWQWYTRNPDKPLALSGDRVIVTGYSYVTAPNGRVVTFKVPTDGSNTGQVGDYEYVVSNVSLQTTTFSYSYVALTGSAGNLTITGANLTVNTAATSSYLSNTYQLIYTTGTDLVPVTYTDIFDYEKYQLINAADLENAGDRILAYYAPTPDMPAKNLPQLINGLEYPGVGITGVVYNANTVSLTSNLFYMFSNTSSLYSSVGDVNTVDVNNMNQTSWVNFFAFEGGNGAVSQLVGVTSVDSQGNVYVPTYVEDSAGTYYFDGLIKVDQTGNVQWADGLIDSSFMQASANVSAFFSSAAGNNVSYTDPAGYVYTVLEMEPTYVFKMSSTGTLMWQTKLNTAPGQTFVPIRVNVDSLGQTFILGWYQNQLNLVKLDQLGNQLFTMVIPPATSSAMMTIGPDDSIVIAATTSTIGQAFIGSYDNINLNQSWGIYMQVAPTAVQAITVNVDLFNSAYVTASVSGEIVLVKLSNGVVQWQSSYGAAGLTLTHTASEIDQQNNVLYVSGEINLSSSFVIKIGITDGTLEWANELSTPVAGQTIAMSNNSLGIYQDRVVMAGITSANQNTAQGFVVNVPAAGAALGISGNLEYGATNITAISSQTVTVSNVSILLPFANVGSIFANLVVAPITSNLSATLATTSNLTNTVDIIHSGDLPLIDFTSYGFALAQPIRITNLDSMTLNLNGPVIVRTGDVLTQTNFSTSMTVLTDSFGTVLTVSNAAVQFDANSTIRVNGLDSGYYPLSTSAITYQYTIQDVSSTQIQLEGPGVTTIPLGTNLKVDYYNFADPSYLDTVIQSQYTDAALGTREEDVDIDGGAYYDTYSSHAPEELVPGVTFDNLNLSVYTKINSNTNIISYRMVHNMQTNPMSADPALWPTYYKIDPAHSTVLTANLNINDSNIYVQNASVLSDPNAQLAIPGVIYINGERIYYYGRDVVNNVLTQIRRAVDGTGTPVTQLAGSAVVDASQNELIPGDAHQTSWLNIVGIPSAYIADNYDRLITTTTGNILITDPPIDGAIFDGTGLEGSTTIQALFLKGTQ
jgi:hypothetical protein